MAQRLPAGTPALLVLQRLGIAHVVHAYDHDPGVASFGAEAARALGVDASRVFKTLLVDIDGTAVVAVVPVSGSLDLKALAAVAGGKKARLVEAARAERLTGYVVGGISPLGQRTPSPTVVDATALDFPTVFVSAGRRGLDVELDPQALVSATGASVASIAAG